MERLLDKMILLVCCTVLSLQNGWSVYTVIPILIAVGVSAFLNYFNRQGIRIALYLCFTAVCLFFPALWIFMPLIVYDIAFETNWWILLFSVLPWTVVTSDGNQSFIIFFILVTACLLKKRTHAYENLKQKHRQMRDANAQAAGVLECKNKELMEKQDYEINLATLNERNRIAREIHDSVGHLLSSSILQLGALMVVTREEQTKKGLLTLKDTLDTGMDSIRDSIHNLYEESVDLHMELLKLTEDFQFCPLFFHYHVVNVVDNKVKYALIAIVKEALTNVAKHSKATEADITLREHPAIYQLIVADNGIGSSDEPLPGGIGLKNIAERVAAFDGIMNVTTKNGFRLFITLPKGE